MSSMESLNFGTGSYRIRIDQDNNQITVYERTTTANHIWLKTVNSELELSILKAYILLKDNYHGIHINSTND